MALSYSALSHTLRGRKNDAIKERAPERGAVVLTSCPSCVQGLSRQERAKSHYGKHLAVFLAEKHLGANFKAQFIQEISETKGIEEIIL